MIEKAKKELEKLLKGNENFINGNPQAVTKSLETLQKFEKYSHKQGFSTETYSFFSQCLNTFAFKKNILFQLCDLLKYRYFNKTANKIYRNSVKMQK